MTSSILPSGASSRARRPVCLTTAALRRRILFLAGALLLAAPAGHAVAPQEKEAPDPAAVALGERLFLETRFAQFFATHSGGDPNATLFEGDWTRRRPGTLLCPARSRASR